ncbi:ESPR-type extended signal peptide-containing protein [Stenotrophomonas indicatrix]|uniref:ESPR-type extended signal peptide-containing protein n=1 Tax=Stenotrophomonas indicatrix TaxID=2045451 RepID=UPI0008AB823B|nr:ESPR-type extended signal peptide-containing protein [Stenotrophomonas indicatrix]SET24662.1 Autotransporter adhesin [Stenotrophomonas indicatrix]
MNTIYRIVWNTALGKWVVASELAHGRGKRTARRTVLSCLLSALLVTSAAAADAGPDVACPAVDNEVVTCDVDASPNTGALLADADPVNGAQLRSSVQSIADAFGGGAAVDPDGVLIAPSYVLGGTTYGNVGSALNGLDARITDNEQAIANIPNGSRFIAVFGNTGTAAATNTGPNSLAVGQGAYATGNGANAFGATARATNNGALAVGVAANASGNNSTAIGLSSASSGGNTVAIGTGARGTSGSATAIGASTNVAGSGSTAVGYYAAIGSNSANAVAIGSSSSVTANVNNGMAIGAGSRVSGASSSALGYQAQATGTNAVAIGAGSIADRGDTVSLGTAGAERQLVNVANATQSTDAVNLGQLHSATSSVAAALGGGTIVASDGSLSAPSYTVNDVASGRQETVDNVGSALDTLNGSVVNVDARMTTLVNAIDAGTVGLVQQSNANADITVGAGTGGGRLDIRGAAGARSLDGLADGVVAADSLQAVNGRQLHATNAQVSSNTTSIVALQEGLSGATRYVKVVGRNDGSDDAQAVGLGAVAFGRAARASVADATAIGAGAVAAGIETVAVGAGAQATGENSVALGAGSVATRDNVVSLGAGYQFGNGSRQLINVANGTENADAVNVQQLRPVVAALGGGATMSAMQGIVTGPRYVLQGNDYNNVGDALNAVDGSLTALDGRVAINEGDITEINNVLNNLSGGAAGLVRQASPSDVVTVAAGSGGGSVDFSGLSGARQLKGVANGIEDADAVNVSQLSAAIEGVRSGDTRYFKADGEGDGSDDASVSGQGAVAAGANARAAGDGSVALGQGAHASADNAVALGANSVADRANSVAVGAAGAERQITHVADASEDTDAVNLRQLKAAGLIGDGGQSLDAVVYDVDSQRGRITFGGAAGTVLGNVADGRIGQGSREAVNGGQIAALRDQLNGQIGHLDERVSQVESGAGSGGKDTPYYDANAADSAADGASPLAGAGTPATAAGAGSVAAGSGANASAANAVALGAGSLADRDNTVAVGHEGGERQITHVARGVRDTDAVNVSQLNQGLNDAKAYADSRVQDVWEGLNDRVDHVSRQANRGIAGAAALIQVTPYLPGKTVLNAGMASYRGETALGVGISRWSDNGRVNINAGVSAARGDRPILRFGVGIVLGD